MLCNGTPEPNQRNRARWAVTRCRITCAFVSKRTVAHVNDPLFVHHTNVRVCAHFPVSESPFGGWKDEIEAKPIRKRNKKINVARCQYILPRQIVIHVVPEDGSCYFFFLIITIFIMQWYIAGIITH